jgi:hypothetical protein
MFELGSKYEDRNGVYTVLELKGPVVLFAYDGADRVILKGDREIKERIHRSVVAEREVPKAKAQVTRRQYRTPGASGSSLIDFLLSIREHVGIHVRAHEDLMGWMEIELSRSGVDVEIHSKSTYGTCYELGMPLRFKEELEKHYPGTIIITNNRLYISCKAVVIAYLKALQGV